MSAKLPKLSPTSYALLGLLAAGPKSAYELNSTMQTSLIRVYWPRAESHVYSEPKKLLAHGLVTEHSEENGARKRRVYTISSRGIAALTNWLAEESSSEFRSQAEFMLKLILANRGSIDSARNTLEQSLQGSMADLDEAITGIRAILDNHSGATPGMPWNGIVINMMAETLVARHRWTQYALELAQQLEDTDSESKREQIGRDAYKMALARLEGACG